MNQDSAQFDADGWKQFVLHYGWQARIHELSHVLGQEPQTIEQFRRTGALRKLPKRKSFDELFSLWHGRAPADADWPIPFKYPQRNTYEWQRPELALLASLVGQLGVKEIADTLTQRLRKITGDESSQRNGLAVQNKIAQLGLQATDVLGGLTIQDAGKEIGSIAIVQHAIRMKQLRAKRVGRLWVIPYEVWNEWKSKRVFAPEGWIQLSSLKEPLAIRSDKLSEFARMGYIPTAIRVTPVGASGPTTQFGSWYIDPKIAAQLLADRKAGKPMPWHGKPLIDNLRVTYRLWSERKHPDSCETCTHIWGSDGAPKSFEEYIRRYPGLAHGAKRHLTRPWTPGMTLQETADHVGLSIGTIKRAVKNGMLAVQTIDGRQYVTKTDATRWKARKCPTGESSKSWVSLQTASSRYLFTITELQGFIADETLCSKVGENGPSRGVTYVLRHQCARLREQIGFTPEEAAKRVGVTLERFETLLEGVDWRKAEKIPLVTVQAVIKRLNSRPGYTIDEAAIELGTSARWVQERVQDGTVKVTQAHWDRRRTYLSEPMMDRLREALNNPQAKKRFGKDWLHLSEAALEAGVSQATITKWAQADELPRSKSSTGWRYQRKNVRARAMEYWKNVRFVRATPPSWLQSHK